MQTFNKRRFIHSGYIDDYYSWTNEKIYKIASYTPFNLNTLITLQNSLEHIIMSDHYKLYSASNPSQHWGIVIDNDFPNPPFDQVVGLVKLN